MLGSQIEYTNYGAEFFAEDGGLRLVEGETYSEIFVVSNEGFGGIIHAIDDGSEHDQEVIDYCKRVVENFLVSCK
ncbi:hypothetical protein A2572_01195 [Candidatus Collierbacteria bacterium RIFOXYD1_FULL_40_9]|uniref:Uncharacterized protein n=1 Tax=Candidatus Collierbacteria bacterium RIFOXYD1_FULL_40_9 TaxID=1817731 RepID=A0A1F5FP63_9BACT|nr:MAG: hypothetical protein A2572_01195 [Candidatus Collierbacteria bacterium RIFOXYD1_FULL_40_9]